MRWLSSFVLGLRPWLIAAVVWMVAAATIYEQNPNPRSSLVLGLLLTFFVGGAGLVAVAWPMRTYGNPPMLVAAARPAAVFTYTGRVASAAKTSFTDFRAESSVRQNPVTGNLSHDMSVQQQTVVQDDLTLLGADGTQYNLQVRWFNLAVGPGQLVSAAWAIRPGRRRGPYVMVRNHTTGQNTYPRPLLWWLATGKGAIVYLLSMWIGAILLGVGGHPRLAATWFFLMPFVYIGLGYYRAARFGRGARSLEQFLDGVAATFGPAPVADTSATSTGQSPISPSRVPPPPPAVQAGPAWYPDPTGRHDHRYFDGLRWTDRVADASVQALDPL